MFRCLTALLAFCLPATSALAALEIVTATYGTASEYRDIRGVLEAYVRSNTLSFPVNARSMGGKPATKARKALTITYKANGRTFQDIVADGKTFTFQGVPYVQRAKAPLGLSFLQRSPNPTPLTIVNHSGAPARVYCVDRYQAWRWAADVANAQTIAVTALVGEQWVATDEAGRALSRVRVVEHDATFFIAPAGEENRPVSYRGEDASVRFLNAGSRPLYLYTLDNQGRWTWMALLDQGGSYLAETHVGAQWIATSTSNQTVRQTTVAPGLSEVRID